jgi:uncharacterized protein (UPF0548 family)
MLEGEIVTLRERVTFSFNPRLELSAGRFHKDSATLWVQEWKPFKLSTLRVKAGQEIVVLGHLIRVLEVNPHNVRPYVRVEVVETRASRVWSLPTQEVAIAV